MITTNVRLHVWEKFGVELKSKHKYKNPYLEVDVWIDLKGPDFDKRVYGFWDGEDRFVVNITAVSPGNWSWVSGCNTGDAGLEGVKGSFEALQWSEEEKQDNLCRRGFIRATENGHAFQLADGTPFYYLADTWWAVPSYRFPWFDDDQDRPLGPDMGFKDMVKFRKKQGYSGIAMLAGHPNWANDGHPSFIQLDDEQKTVVRQAWTEENDGVVTVKDMHNEGGRPFLFPGIVKGYEDVVPDFNRINPEYFKFMDRKVDYLNSQGMIPFIEVARRDVSQVWKNYYEWPDSYARYIQYIFCRYHANNVLLSPIHMDSTKSSIPSRAYNEPANMVVDKCGHPPFGTLVGTNSAPSSLMNFGSEDEAGWLTFHQVGNWDREHDIYWYLTDIYHSLPPKPALNGEPYYPGWGGRDTIVPAESSEAALKTRSSMYGSFLSGGFAGFIYGSAGLWGGDRNKSAEDTMWDALKFQAADEVRHLGAFVHRFYDRYQSLVPCADMVSPNKAGEIVSYFGWAYCAHTPDKKLVLIYLEKECPRVKVRVLIPETEYKLTWFKPETGEWIEYGTVITSQEGNVAIPEPPGSEDWALSLKVV